jgi:hypothetical protein
MQRVASSLKTLLLLLTLVLYITSGDSMVTLLFSLSRAAVEHFEGRVVKFGVVSGLALLTSFVKHFLIHKKVHI